MIVHLLLTILFFSWIIGCSLAAFKIIDPVDPADYGIAVLLAFGLVVLSGVALTFSALAVCAIWSL